jgi:hypothetical protein
LPLLYHFHERTKNREPRTDTFSRGCRPLPLLYHFHWLVGRASARPYGKSLADVLMNFKHQIQTLLDRSPGFSRIRLARQYALSRQASNRLKPGLPAIHIRVHFSHFINTSLREPYGGRAEARPYGKSLADVQQHVPTIKSLHLRGVGVPASAGSGVPGSMPCPGRHSIG